MNSYRALGLEATIQIVISAGRKGPGVSCVQQSIEVVRVFHLLALVSSHRIPHLIICISY